MASSESVTGDDVNVAFHSGSVRTDSDAKLMQYLRVLCYEQFLSDENKLLANNRCITINTILTQRYMERMDRVTTRYTWVVIILAVASLIASIVQIVVALK